MKTKPAEKQEVSVAEVNLTDIEFCLLGVTPLVPHAVSVKAKQQLLYPSKKKNQAEKDSSMKHDPYEEFRDAAYKFKDDEDQPTKLYMPGTCFHAAMANAAIDMVGAKKAQVGRLTNIMELKVPVWGVPQIYSTVVRSSDMARTPDVRTLPILVQWATKVRVQFVSSLIKPGSIVNLLSAAGLIIGIGDGRPEKGKLSFGKFRIVNEDDPGFRSVIKHGGRAAQEQALADPVFYDVETEQLLTWFVDEKENRVARPAETRRKAGRNGGAEAQQA